MRRTLDYPQLWFAGLAALAVASGLGWNGAPAGRFLWLGVIFVMAGILLMLGAVFAMRGARTTVDPYGQPRVLVTTGVFALSRNPIYLGNALILTGLCVIFGVAIGALLIVPGFVWVINRRFIPREEQRLRKGFAHQFDSYSARTRRWI